MTHSHDLDVAAAALLAGRFAYVGVIGSATKRARFAGALRQIDLSDDDIARLICPIGLPEIRDKAPAAIAAAVAAQLLIRRDATAGRVAVGAYLFGFVTILQLHFLHVPIRPSSCRRCRISPRWWC